MSRRSGRRSSGSSISICINDGEMRFSVGAVNVRSGNFVYFDNTTHQIRPEHVMASGSLPPGFPATVIDGEYYWDGGLVSNTPLQWVLDNRPRLDTLAFQVDLWNARGELPRNLIEVGFAPEGDPLFQPHPRGDAISSRNSNCCAAPSPSCCRAPHELAADSGGRAAREGSRRKGLQPDSADLPRQKLRGQLPRTMSFRAGPWRSTGSAGYNDAVRTLRHPEVLQRPKGWTASSPSTSP